MIPGRGRSRGGSGPISRRGALALIAASGLGSLGVSGAFSSVQGPRRFDFGSRDDDAALLRLESTTAGNPPGTPLNTQTVSFTASDGEVLDLITISNFVEEPVEFTTLTLEPVAQASDLTIALQNPPTALAYKEQATLSAAISCTEIVEDAPATLSIIAEGETTTIELSRTVRITCTHPICDVTTDLIQGGGGWGGTTAGTVDVLRTYGNVLEIDVGLDDSTGSGSGGNDQDDEANDGGSSPWAGSGDGDDDEDENDDEECEDDDDEDDHDGGDHEDDDEDGCDSGGTQITELHVDVQTDPCDFPKGIGNYHYVAENIDSTTHSLSIDLADLGIDRDTSVVVAVHAALSNGESAWAEGPDQPVRNDWSMYVQGCYDGDASCEDDNGLGEDGDDEGGNGDDEDGDD